MNPDKLIAAADLLSQAVDSGQLAAASLYAQEADKVFARAFGAATSVDDIFLLASISKTIAAAAVMKLYDEGKFKLDDPARTFLPELIGDGREKITVRQLLTHVSGLPDQLPNNAELRAAHAPL
jgi:CubicO group peptidase (beta-lactamase class C family)